MATAMNQSHVMFHLYQNLTQIFLLQNAVNTILDTIAKDTDTHAVCIVRNGRIDNWVQLKEFPSVESNCQMLENEFSIFVNQMQQGVSIGCSLFVVVETCARPFLDNFRAIHDWVQAKYEKKVLVLLDTLNALTNAGIRDILRHSIVMNDIPLTLLLQPNVDIIEIWSAFPYGSSSKMYNRFFLNNFSLEYDKQMIPKITNLEGFPVYGSFISIPPYTAYYFVPPGTGNAQLYNSSEPFTVQLEGQEHAVLLEFCVKYNCTLTARLEYDDWGEIFPNMTGFGTIGALATRDSNVTCGGIYLWDQLYQYTQYSAIIQKAICTHIVPKSLPLPYWKTPILPFPGYIWSFVIGSFLIGAVTLFIVNATQTKFNYEEDGHVTFVNSIYAVYMMSIFQGVNIRIEFLSNIVIFTVLLIYALVIGNLYTGGLASVMTLIQYEEPVDSMEKLIETELEWGSFTWDWMFAIQHSDYPPHQKYLSKFVVASVEELYQLVEQRKIAVVVETLQHGTLSYQEYIDKETSKSYMMMKNMLYWQNTIIMTGKTWPFMEQLNRIVLMQQESGIRYYWEQMAAYITTDYDIQRNIEENGKPPEEGETISLSIQHILGALCVLLFGYIGATITFLCELLWTFKIKKVGAVTKRSLFPH